MGFVRAAYLLGVGGWGIQPSEFWGMDFCEWVWLYAAKRPQRTQEWAGNLTDQQVIDLSAALDEAVANEQDRVRSI